MENIKLIPSAIALISIIIYLVIFIKENINNEENEKGTVFLIITLIALIMSLIFLG